MPNISSETLFHFTNLENLKGILRNEFHPKYSFETLDFKGKNPSIGFAYAMTCFCDIPLTQVNEHLTHYGNYGIGMSREWITSKKLNPVMYFKGGSDLSNWLRRLLYGTAPLKAAEDHNAREIKSGLTFLMRHIKPFEGTLYKTGDRVKFYNEREWRYVPFIINDGQTLVGQLTKDEYENPDYLRENNEKIKRFKLGFDPKDIKYIIVKEDREILEMVRYLHEVKSPKYDEDTIKILTSRIITIEQIQKDF